MTFARFRQIFREEGIDNDAFILSKWNWIKSFQGTESLQDNDLRDQIRKNLAPLKGL